MSIEKLRDSLQGFIDTVEKAYDVIVTVEQVPSSGPFATGDHKTVVSVRERRTE